MTSYERKTLQQLKRSRSAITGVITKTLTKTQPILAKDKNDVTPDEIADLEVRQALFEQKLSEAELLNAAILEQTPDADDEVQEELINASEFHCKISFELKRIVKFLEQFVEPGPSLENAPAPASASPNCASLKMPKFSLPNFDGQYQNWTPFYERFMASVDSSKTLPDIQKFNYLKSSLVGEASQLISYLPLSNTNYKIALKILIDHYDNQRLIMNTHLAAIFNLKPLQSESASKLRKLIVAFEENLMTIQALKVDVTSSDFVWVHVLAKKLDPESRRQFELGHPGKELQTLQQLTEFINRRVQALEASDTRNYRVKNDKTSAITERTSKQNFQNSITQNYKATFEKCCVCSADHKIFNCEKFKTLDFKAKKALFFNSKLCFNCLQEGHLTKDCKSKSTCKVCNGKHNSLLHNENAGTRIESTSTLVSGQALLPSNIGILPTAMVSIEDDSSNIIDCRALLDSGSQMSLISEEAVQRMKLKRQKQSLTVNGIGNVHGTYNSGKVQLKMKSKTGKPLEVQAFILPNLTQHLPNRSFKTTGWLQMRTVELADPHFNERKPIDLTLGADVFKEIILDHSFKEENGLHFRISIFGWIASGNQPIQESSSLTTSLCINEIFDLKKF